MARTYITVSIPYVNARPHVGYALELVEADVLARQRRATGGDVRFLGGTDDHALKNVLGAEAAGVPTQDFVDAERGGVRSAARPAPHLVRRLHPHQPRPSSPRRASSGCGARRRRTATSTAAGTRARTASGASGSTRSPSWSTAAVRSTARRRRRSAEENWFFRLSRYQRAARRPHRGAATLEIVPETYRNEVLAFLAGGLDDISVSRSQTARTRVGDPRARRSVAGDLRVVGRARRTTSPRSTTGPTVTRSTRGGARPTSASTWSARGSCASTRCTGRRCCCRRASCRPRRSSCIPISPPGARSSRSRPATRSTRSRSSTRSAPTRCAGGCCATCPAPWMPTSPSSGW